MLTDAPLLHVASYLAPGASFVDAQWTTTAVAALAYLAVVAGAGGYLLYFELIRSRRPDRDQSRWIYRSPLRGALRMGCSGRNSCCTDDNRFSGHRRWLRTYQISNHHHRTQSENRGGRQLATVIRSTELLLGLIEDRLERPGLNVPA